MGFLRRWYDNDPRISLAVGCLEKASMPVKIGLAQAIIKKAKSMDIEAKDHPVIFFRRWYDENKTLRIAMECFKLAPPLLQRSMAEYIIAKLTQD